MNLVVAVLIWATAYPMMLGDWTVAAAKVCNPPRVHLRARRNG